MNLDLVKRINSFLNSLGLNFIYVIDNDTILINISI